MGAGWYVDNGWVDKCGVVRWMLGRWMDVSMNVRRIGGCWLDRWML
jgi:hypothetical protein